MDVDSYLDLDRGMSSEDNRGEVPVEGLLYPYFLRDIQKYREVLDKIAEVNFIDEPKSA